MSVRMREPFFRPTPRDSQFLGQMWSQMKKKRSLRVCPTDKSVGKGGIVRFETQKEWVVREKSENVKEREWERMETRRKEEKTVETLTTKGSLFSFVQDHF